LVYNLSSFPPISMGQMAVEVVGLSLFLLLAFRATVTAVGEGSEGIYGPFIAIVYIQDQQESKLNWFKRD